MLKQSHFTLYNKIVNSKRVQMLIIRLEIVFVNMLDFFIDSFMDALIDSAKLLPFLFVIYILLEWFNRNAGANTYKLIKKNEKIAPLLGGAIGVIPQCGLSAAAATLYSGKVVTMGTMLAVFLSASDDMLPIFISTGVPVLSMIKILALKMCIGIVSGYAVDLVLKYILKKNAVQKAPMKMMSKKRAVQSQNMEICTQSCCTGPFWIAILKHTAQVFVFIFVVSLILNLIIGFVGEDALGAIFKNVPILGEFIAAIIGLIPNCASSVVITQLYLSGVMTAGALFAGLLVNAGVGTLVLLRTNKNKRENISIIVSLYFIGVFWGIIIELLGLTF